MFHCRHRLLQVRLPPVTITTHLSTRRTITNAKRAIDHSIFEGYADSEQRRTYSRRGAEETSVNEEGAHASAEATHPLLEDDASSREKSRSKECQRSSPATMHLGALPHDPSPPDSSELLRMLLSREGTSRFVGAVHASYRDPLVAYDHLRKHAKQLLLQLPQDAYVRLAHAAKRSNSRNAMDDLSKDAAEVFAADPKTRASVYASMLSIFTQDAWLPLDRILHYMSVIEKGGGPAAIPPIVVARITKFVANQAASERTDALEGVLPVLLRCIRAAEVPADARAMTHQALPYVRMSVLLVRKLLDVGRETEALDVLQALADSHNAPPEALTVTEGGSQEFNAVVRTALLRTSMFWRWHGETAGIFAELIGDKVAPNLDHGLVDLALDVIGSLLHTPTEDSLRSCFSIITRLHHRSAKHAIPSSLIQKYYATALELELHAAAEHLYMHLVDSAGADGNAQLPGGVELIRLMYHLTSRSRNFHLARVMATQVVEQDPPLPLQRRSMFVTCAAKCGFATEARVLYERYSVGQDGAMVYGNARLVIRLLSLYQNLISRLQSRLGLPRSAPSTPDVYRQAAVVKEDGAEGHNLQAQLDDYLRFSERVLTAFRESKQPLRDAQHSDLNALARAHFILGQFRTGFDCMRILIDRREVPDMRDINVALSAMAEYDPRLAATYITRMIEQGLEPDGVSFRTVLHQLILRQDWRSVSDLSRLGLETSESYISIEAVTMLIQAAMRDPSKSKEDISDSLRDALSIMKSLDYSKAPGATPQAGRMCIDAALRANDADLAFQFWRLFLRDKVEWGDMHQRVTRLVIAREIWLSHNAGKVTKLTTLGWLKELGVQRQHVWTGKAYFERKKRIQSGLA